MAFIMVTAAAIGVFAALLWFTGWAEQRVIAPESKPIEAKLQ